MALASPLAKLSPIASKVYMGVLAHKNGTDLIAISPSTLVRELGLPLKEVRTGAKECVYLKFLESIGGSHFRVLPMPNENSSNGKPAVQAPHVPAELILAFREVPRDAVISPSVYTAFVAKMLRGLGYMFNEKVDTPAGKIAFLIRHPRKLAIEIGSTLSQGMIDRLNSTGPETAKLLLLRGATSRAPTVKGIMVLRSQIELGATAHQIAQCFSQATGLLRVTASMDSPFGRGLIKLIRANLRLGYTLADLIAVVKWADQRSREERWHKLRSLHYLWGKEFPSHLAATQPSAAHQAHDPRQYLAKVSRVTTAPLPEPI
jgi:hypothetical protein